jgi:hypothetical protein
LGYLLGKIIGGVIAIISFRPGGWMQQSAVPRCNRTLMLDRRFPREAETPRRGASMASVGDNPQAAPHGEAHLVADGRFRAKVDGTAPVEDDPERTFQRHD